MTLRKLVSIQSSGPLSLMNFFLCQKMLPINKFAGLCPDPCWGISSPRPSAARRLCSRLATYSLVQCCGILTFCFSVVHMYRDAPLSFSMSSRHQLIKQREKRRNITKGCSSHKDAPMSDRCGLWLLQQRFVLCFKAYLPIITSTYQQSLAMASLKTTYVVMMTFKLAIGW